jgi:hypothetical protein
MWAKAGLTAEGQTALERAIQQQVTLDRPSDLASILERLTESLAKMVGYLHDRSPAPVVPANSPIRK